MPMIDIVRYTPSRQHEWNTFVAEAINATFLFRRQYMDYHAQRFADHSLMAYDKGRLVAILPAHEDGERLCSHNGLTFGGLLTAAHTTTAERLQACTHHLPAASGSGRPLCPLADRHPAPCRTRRRVGHRPRQPHRLQHAAPPQGGKGHQERVALRGKPRP